MKLKLATLVLASAAALSSSSAFAHVHKHNHYRNSYNAMNMTQGRSLPSGYARPAFAPGDSNLSGTGPSTYGGSGDAGGVGGGSGG